jgi:hypothetical protein
VKRGNNDFGIETDLVVFDPVLCSDESVDSCIPIWERLFNKEGSFIYTLLYFYIYIYLRIYFIIYRNYNYCIISIKYQ